MATISKAELIIRSDLSTQTALARVTCEVQIYAQLILRGRRTFRNSVSVTRSNVVCC